MEQYNLDKLISVGVVDFEQDGWYEFKREKKYLFRKPRKEGFYFGYDGRYYTDKLPEHYTMIDGVVYLNPKVVMRFEDEINKCLFFKHLSSAENFVRNNIAIKNCLNIKE